MQMSVEAIVSESSTEAERWAAWQARGRAHHRAVRRKRAIVVPIVAIGAAIAFALVIW
jgi:hypothetical protein